MKLPGYDRWLESGPGGPYDDGDVACEHCEAGRVPCCGDDGCGECGGTNDAACPYCSGTGVVLASDREDDSTEPDYHDEGPDRD